MCIYIYKSYDQATRAWYHALARFLMCPVQGGVEKPPKVNTSAVVQLSGVHANANNIYIYVYIMHTV